MTTSGRELKAAKRIRQKRNPNSSRARRLAKRAEKRQQRLAEQEHTTQTALAQQSVANPLEAA